MTKEEYDALPGLISRSEFQRASGLSDHDLQACVHFGDIATWPPPKEIPRDANGRPRRYVKYYKRDLAKFLGFDHRRDAETQRESTEQKPLCASAPLR